MKSVLPLLGPGCDSLESHELMRNQGKRPDDVYPTAAYLCSSSGRSMSSWASSALAISSFSFFTVSLPMWFSLLMGSSSDGMSCFLRFFVRFVTTCRHRQTPESWELGCGWFLLGQDPDQGFRMRVAGMRRVQQAGVLPAGATRIILLIDKADDSGVRESALYLVSAFLGFSAFLSDAQCQLDPGHEEIYVGLLSILSVFLRSAWPLFCSCPLPKQPHLLTKFR